jgi:hypothetical protein
VSRQPTAEELGAAFEAALTDAEMLELVKAIAALPDELFLEWIEWHLGPAGPKTTAADIAR